MKEITNKDIKETDYFEDLNRIKETIRQNQIKLWL